MNQPFTLDPRALDRLAGRCARRFGKASPFPHVVIDDGLVPDDVLLASAAEFPSPASASWFEHSKTTAQRKFTNSCDWTMGPVTRQVLAQLNSASFCRFLEQVTGIPGLIPDPHLEGGGMHQIGRGGFLKIHADYNVHPMLRLHRRLNVLLYLNPGWREEWGGAVEFWDRGMTRCERRIAPELGRCVVFATTDWSHHGHPDALTCPEDVTRKSLALYYYTADRPADEKSSEHTTMYRSRPGESVTPTPKQPRGPVSLGGRVKRRLRRRAP